jgi:predicted metal-dependent hydrolase
MSIEILLKQTDTAVQIELRRSSRAKHISLQADIYGIRVVAPIHQSVESIKQFVNSKRQWISKVYDYYSRLKKKIGESEIQKDTILFFGKRYRIKITKDKQQEYAIVSDNLNQITFHVKDKRSYKRYLRIWYREQTKKILDERLPVMGSKFSLSYKKISVRNLKSRWGSCSKTGNLSFSLLLSMLPVDVIDYIIVHELMHLVEFNHSKRFWQLVGEAIPQYDEHRKWLRTHSLLVKID